MNFKKTNINFSQVLGKNPQTVRKTYIRFFILICIIVVLFALIQYKEESIVEIGGQKIRVEVVFSQEDQNIGLSDRESMAQDEGMLFVFEKPGRHSFWMKDMNFPIDIIWFDGDKKVIYIKEDARPESYPEIFEPGLEASYVLEVVSGFSEKNNLKIGDKAVFTYQ